MFNYGALSLASMSYVKFQIIQIFLGDRETKNALKNI